MEDEQIRQDHSRIESELARIKENEESLQKSYDYYKDDLVPTIECKFRELQIKIKGIEVEKQSLVEQNKHLIESQEKT